VLFAVAELLVVSTMGLRT